MADVERAVTLIKKAMEIDVSWNSNPQLHWDNPGIPPLEELGIDDSGDTRDYILGVRLLLIAALMALNGEVNNG